MITLSFFNSDINRPQIISIFYIEIYNYLSRQKITEIFHTIHSEILQPYYETSKIRAYESIPLLQELLGESGRISIDLNMDYYGPEYSESILSEWENKQLIIHSSTNQEDMVFFESEGSLSIFENIFENIIRS